MAERLPLFLPSGSVRFLRVAVLGLMDRAKKVFRYEKAADAVSVLAERRVAYSVSVAFFRGQPCFFPVYH